MSVLSGRWAKLSQRVVSGAALIALVFYTIFRTSPLYFSLVVIAFIVLALYEFLTLLKTRDIPINRVFGLSMGVIIPAVVYMELGVTQSGEILFLILGCLFLFILQFFRKSHIKSLIGIALTLFGILYISWFLSFLIKIRFLTGGAMWVAFLLMVTKACDIGAYVLGTLFGRHKLIPHISPKKSVEGALGGLAASVLTAWALCPYLPLDFSLQHVLLLGLAIGFLGQIGDLSESLMKRFCESKDSGDLFPGMGGVLDVVDSVLFTAPIFYFHLKIYL